MNHDRRKTPENSLCHQQGCMEAASYRAPRAPEKLDEYYWFCLEHVRAYNKTWNYYQNMDEGMMARDQYNDLLGNRPSWPFGGAEQQQQFQQSFDKGFDANEFTAKAHYDWRFGDDNGDDFFAQPPQKIPAPIQRALKKMQLALPIDSKTLKKRYKVLVKQLHPDLNGLSVVNEKRLQDVNLAYHELKQWLQ
ncbi:MAG: J domain-containing protein [Alphaproteobacteria bacterium]|nr:J domain-containing protein [Alphaproteobacteria bacterium]